MLPNGGETPNPLRSRRTARLNERIREVVSEVILFELKDPRIGFVTVLQAEVTADIREATVRLSVMGTEAQKKLTLGAIEHSRGYIQRRLGKSLKTRNTPSLRFTLDERSEKATQLDEAFERLRREREDNETEPRE